MVFKKKVGLNAPFCNEMVLMLYYNARVSWATAIPFKLGIWKKPPLSGKQV